MSKRGYERSTKQGYEFTKHRYEKTTHRFETRLIAQEEYESLVGWQTSKKRLINEV